MVESRKGVGYGCIIFFKVFIKGYRYLIKMFLFWIFLVGLRVGKRVEVTECRFLDSVLY